MVAKAPFSMTACCLSVSLRERETKSIAHRLPEESVWHGTAPSPSWHASAATTLLLLALECASTSGEVSFCLISPKLMLFPGADPIATDYPFSAVDGAACLCLLVLE